MPEMLARDEIARLAHEEGMIEPLIEEELNPASYDLHIGERLFDPTKKGGKMLTLWDLPDHSYSLLPGQTVVLYSLETVKLPLDVQGLLVLRASWATKGLYYAGGLVKPGYWGKLFFSVTNLSLHTIDLLVEEALASIAFFRLPKAVGRFPEKPIVEIPPSFRPLPPERDIYSPLKVSEMLGDIQSTLETYKTANHTLRADELRKYVERYKMIEDFEEEALKGITYDFRVGNTIILGKLKEGEKGELQLEKVHIMEEGEAVEIEPGLSAVVYSYEKVHMPWDVKARLSIRSAFMAQRLNYDGGIIDPGYQGRLFFTVTNLGDTSIFLHYKERLVTAEFISLGEEIPIETQEKLKQRKGFGTPLETLPPERYPRPASEEWYTLQELSSKLKEVNKNVEELQMAVREVKLNQRPAQVFMELFVFAALVGLAVALFGQNGEATNVTKVGIWGTLLVGAAMIGWLVLLKIRLKGGEEEEKSKRKKKKNRSW